VRHPHADLLRGAVTLDPEEGEGYWKLTRIRDDFYVIIKKPLQKQPLRSCRAMGLSNSISKYPAI